MHLWYSHLLLSLSYQAWLHGLAWLLTAIIPDISFLFPLLSSATTGRHELVDRQSIIVDLSNYLTIASQSFGLSSCSRGSLSPMSSTKTNLTWFRRSWCTSLQSLELNQYCQTSFSSSVNVTKAWITLSYQIKHQSEWLSVLLDPNQNVNHINLRHLAKGISSA